jgi:transcriptional regulator GlxA family with amidase domain
MDKRKRVGILVFDNVTTLDVIGPADAFAAARVARPHGVAPETAYDVVTIGVTKRACVSESNVKVCPTFSLENAPALDTLIVPGGSGLREARTNRAVSCWIRERAKGVRRIVSVCTGVYGLAPVGLLDGRRVTTHWAFAADVAKRFPKLRVEANEIFIKDGRFFTSAGVTAGIDLSLSLIQDDLGAAASLAVARELVVYVRRDGGQAQFSEPLRFQSTAPDRFADLVSYIAGHLDADLSVPALARRMAVSARQFSRQCQSALGASPAALVMRMRLDEAKVRLLRRGTSVEAVSDSLAFSSPDAFRRAFERQFGVNPSAFRARFRASA